MPLPSFPFETNAPFLERTWQAAIRPLRAPRTVWDEIFRGESLLAPLGFAWLGLLAATPWVVGAAAFGVAGLQKTMGASSPLFLNEILKVAPGVLALFLLGPVILGLLAGSMAHGVLWILDPGVRGHLRGSLRASLYAYAWSIPWVAVVAGGSLYFLFNPLAGIRFGPAPYRWLARAPATPLLALQIFEVLALAASLALGTWALAAFHRSAGWKAFLATLLGLGLVGSSEQILAMRTAHKLVRAGITLQEPVAENPRDPAVRIRRLIKAVQGLQSDTQATFRKVGLPDPPRSVDLLTGGDWSAGIDLGQASQNGFLPSCQRVFLLTEGALRGQAIFLSDCLGQARPSLASPLPDPLMPPGSGAQALGIRQHLTPPQQAALTQARKACLDLIGWMESYIGPFPEEAVVPGETAPSTPAPDNPDQPSVPISERIPFNQVLLRAQQGDPAAMNELGRKYFFGQDAPGLDRVEKNRTQGLLWMERAFGAGFRSVESCTCLMVSYATGQGVPMDRAVSEQWRSRAEAIRDPSHRRAPEPK
jgi:hypothetical protein